MRQFLLAFALLTLVSLGRVSAQNDIQKIESAKIGFITNRLNLTSDQAPPFWTIYKEYNAKRKELNRQVRQLTGSTLRSSDAMSNIRDLNATKQKLGDLDTEYTPRFLKVISPQQLQELYKTEHDFNRQLLDKLNNDN